jgi:uncharacterized protein (DUF305 family)
MKISRFVKRFGVCPEEGLPSMLNCRQVRFCRDREPGSAPGVALRASLVASIFVISLFPSASAQQTVPAKPVVVQPGAPGAPSKTLPSSTRAVLPSRSQADVEFMQGMILHHAQAVEMTAMIPSHTQNKDLRSLGARISSSQSDEIKFMKRWLAARGESVPQAMPNMPGMNMSHDLSHDMSHDTSNDGSNDASHDAMALMPGMLTPQQMEALRKAKDAEFDHLFLVGMIQHHNGALTMVKHLFDTAGAGQDAELFNFATDADNSQRAEIRIMENMLKTETPEEKR